VPRVSVIIPTYNHQSYVITTLESVFAQTFNDYEVLVVNDGSPDQTESVLEPLVMAGRIRYIHQPNAGQASARNRGLAEAKGEFVAFLDDDDLWGPAKLQRQVEALCRNPNAVLTYGYVRSFSEADGQAFATPSPTGNVLRQFLRGNWIWSPGQTLMRAGAVRKIGGFDPSIAGADDWDLYIRLAAQGDFIYEDFEALAYRIHSSNASRATGLMYRNMMRIRRKHFGPLPKPSELGDWIACTRYISDYSSLQFCRRTDLCLEKGERLNAARALILACWVKPTLLVNRGTLSRLRKLCTPLIR
jgi:glycosyltransferase involved in cell wall biosynthesis